MAKEDSFVKVTNPKNSRRVILESTRDVLKVLQGYEDFKKIRKKRAELIESFKSTIAETKARVSNLKRMLPKTAVKEAKKPFAVEEKTQQPELKRLEQELSDIEDKLSNL